MDKALKKRIKNVKKIDKLVKKNDESISQILVSELFLQQLKDVAGYVDIEIREEDELEVLYLFNKPINVSSFINDGCILMLHNEEYVVLKGI